MMGVPTLKGLKVVCIVCTENMTINRMDFISPGCSAR